MVLDDHIIGRRQVKRDVRMRQVVPDADNRLEQHLPRLFPLLHVRLHLFRRRYVQRGIHRHARPLDKTAAADAEFLFPHNRHAILHCPVRQNILSRQAHPVFGTHRQHQVPAAPDIHPVASVLRQVHPGMHGLSDFYLHTHRYPAGVHLPERLHLLSRRIAERHETHQIHALVHQCRCRAPQDIGDVRRIQQMHLPRDVKFRKKPRHLRVHIRICLSVNHRRGILADVHDLEVPGIDSQFHPHALKGRQTDCPVQHQLTAVGSHETESVKKYPPFLNPYRNRIQTEHRTEHHHIRLAFPENQLPVDLRRIQCAPQTHPACQYSFQLHQIQGQESIRHIQRKRGDIHIQRQNTLLPIRSHLSFRLHLADTVHTDPDPYLMPLETLVHQILQIHCRRTHPLSVHLHVLDRHTPLHPNLSPRVIHHHVRIQSSSQIRHHRHHARHLRQIHAHQFHPQALPLLSIVR